MPIVTFRSPIDRFRGTMMDQSGSGLTIYDSNKAGNVARSYVVPTNPNSLLQQAVRQAFATASQGFAALSAIEAAAWNSAATAYQRLNPLEVPYDFSGINLFVQVNAYADLANGDSQSTPPNDLATPVLNLDTVTAIATALAPETLIFAVNITSAPAAGKEYRVLVLSTAAWTRTARIPRRTDYAMRDTVAENNVLVYNAGSGLLPVGGSITMDNITKPIAAGDVVWFRCILLSNDYVPAPSPTIFSVVVAAA